MGTASLAKAKGYSSGLVAGLLIVGFFCFPVVIPLAPLIVIFALKDKTNCDPHSHRGSSRPLKKSHFFDPGLAEN